MEVIEAWHEVKAVILSCNNTLLGTLLAPAIQVENRIEAWPESCNGRLLLLVSRSTRPESVMVGCFLKIMKVIVSLLTSSPVKLLQPV